MLLFLRPFASLDGFIIIRTLSCTRFAVLMLTLQYFTHTHTPHTHTYTHRRTTHTYKDTPHTHTPHTPHTNRHTTHTHKHTHTHRHTTHTHTQTHHTHTHTHNHTHTYTHTKTYKYKNSKGLQNSFKWSSKRTDGSYTYCNKNTGGVSILPHHQWLGKGDYKGRNKNRD